LSITTVENAPRRRGDHVGDRVLDVLCGCVAISAAMISESEVELNEMPALDELVVQLDGVDEVPLCASASSRREPSVPAERCYRLRVSHAFDPVVE